jgi:outer membrane biosynthesis protein TonB
MGRKQNDVFVLGDELLVAEPIAPRDPGPAVATDVRGLGGCSPPPPPARPAGFSAGSAMGARRLAVLGLGAAAAATLGALELSSGTGSAHPQGDQASPRSALVVRPVPSAPAPSTPHRAPARPADPKPKPRPNHRSVERRPRDIHRSEPEREPRSEEAPVSSPVEVPVPPSAPLASPVPAPAPSPSSPSPPPGGDGSGSGEQFGFER